MKKNLLLLLCFFTHLHYSTNAQTIIINEVMSANNLTITDEDGDASDWIEIFNYGTQAVSLNGLGLSDDATDLTKWTFPNVSIPPLDYLVVFASGKDKIDPNGTLHTNFKIKQDGEALFLSLGSQIISSTPAVFIPTDQSYGLILHGNLEYAVSLEPSPNGVNVSMFSIAASHNSGFYSDSFHLALLSDVNDQKIFYTLNGSIPSTSSQLYTSPLLITNNINTPNIFSNIPTTPLDGPTRLFEYIWTAPPNVYKSNVIRYASFQGDTMTSPVYSQTFFVDPSIYTRYPYPLVSIITDSLNLFDYETGIYIPGKRFDEQGFGHRPNGNYQNKGRDWERDAFISYFEPDGNVIFETNAGIRVRGFGSTAFPQKSLMAYFRKEYGINKIEYPLFSNSSITDYKRLIFRNSGNDFHKTHFRDAMLQSLLRPLDLELQNFQPAILFLNGEYWGVHNMREKYDKHYFKNHFGIEEDNINILKWCGEVEEGSDDDYKVLMDYIVENDLSQDVHYQYVTNQIDIINYIDFQIAEIYIGNLDWPCNNYKMWKTNEDDAKWRFLIYDLDFSSGINDYTTFDKLGIEHATHLGSVWPYCECSNQLFVQLLKNETFKALFISRFELHLSTIFNVENVLNTIDQFQSIYEPIIDEHIDRWAYPQDIETWQYHIRRLKCFAEQRPCFLKENLINFFELSSFNYDCTPPEPIYLDESTLILASNPNSGVFYLKNNSTVTFMGSMVITNSIGQMVYYQSDLTMNEGEQVDFNLPQLTNGTYFVSLNGEALNHVFKMIVVR